jgi:hypothetical protein
MEFLDINLAKDSSLLLRAIHNPFYWRIFKKIILFSGLKKSANKENLSLFMKSILENEKIRVENQTKSLEFVPRNLEKKCRSRIPSLESSHLRQPMLAPPPRPPWCDLGQR